MTVATFSGKFSVKALKDIRRINPKNFSRLFKTVTEIFFGTVY